MPTALLSRVSYHAGQMVLRGSTLQLADLHDQPVIIITDAGLPVSVGRVLIRGNAASGAVHRVDLEFETERLKCTFRVSAEHWRVLLENWDGETTRYMLPHGDGFWLDEHDKNKVRVLGEFLQHGYPSEHKSRLSRRGPPT